MKYLFTKAIVIVFLLLGSLSCDFLEIVPENTATLEDAFTRPAEAKNFLHSLYSFLPKLNDHLTYPELWGNDEVIIPWTWYDVYKLVSQPINPSNPFFDYWGNPAGHAFSYFEGIRQAYTFLEHIENTPGYSDVEVLAMKGEATFIIGYLHFCLVRQYGPTIIVDKIVALDAPEEEYFPYRSTYDESVEFCVRMFDDAYEMLPETQSKTDFGRITKVVAKAAKARILLYAASPLFNGNPAFSEYSNSNGQLLFPQSYDREKWKGAIEAAEEAFDEANSIGLALYEEYANDPVSNCRYAMVEPWNQELIWGYRHEWYWGWQRHSAPRVIEGGQVTAAGGTAPTLRHIELYYTESGLPIDQDPSFDYSNRFQIAPGDSTIRLHRNREPRFYSNIAFDRGTYEINNASPVMYFRLNERHGYDGIDRSNYTRSGYLIQKGVHPKTMFTNTENIFIEYPWPILRLAELYLNMAEALNEYGYGTTDRFGNDAIHYLNLLRDRAGIPSVEEAWSNSTSPEKHTTQQGLREIIHTERKIELAFEGHRIWDARRWKKGEDLNTPVYGLNIEKSDATGFYSPVKVENRYFDINRSYLWPISLSELQKNPNLVQNPGY
jgi:starch-binding outer membrane protein, SusD/RagB family